MDLSDLVLLQDPAEYEHGAGGAGQLCPHQRAQDLRLERHGGAVQEPGCQHQSQQLGPHGEQEVQAIANQKPLLSSSANHHQTNQSSGPRGEGKSICSLFL